MFTQSIESASLTLTSGAGEAALLKDRNQYTLGIDAASATSSITLEMDFGSTSTTWDYVILANAYSTQSVNVQISYWDGGAWVAHGSAARVLNGHEAYLLVSQAATQWRIVFTRSTATVIKIGAIFAGEKYLIPVDYQYLQPRNTFMRSEVQDDFRGQPYGFSIDTAKKFDHDLTYKLITSQMQALEAQLVNVDYWKPFFWQDTNLSSAYRLVKPVDPSIQAIQPSADLFDVRLRMVEL